MQLVDNLKYLIWMMLLAILQIVIFNHIDFFGFANPYFYVIFILLYPLNKNRYLFLIYAFLLGVTIDFFEHTGGINAFASVFVAYFRIFLLRYFIKNNRNKEYEDMHLADLSRFQWFIYMILVIFCQQFMIDFIENPNWGQIRQIAANSSVGAMMTFVLVLVFLLLFPVTSKEEF